MNSSSVVVAKASSMARRLRRLSFSTGSPSFVFSNSSSSWSASSTATTPIQTVSAASISTKQSHRNYHHRNYHRPQTLRRDQQQTTRRCFGSGGGTRGSRGHGWWQNYRAGKGGRHLQGAYGHLDLEGMAEWNDAVFGLGSKLVYMDVKAEALAGTEDTNENNDGDPQQQQHIHRLTLELATEAMPLATNNFLKLIQEEVSSNAVGYHSSTLHRIEKGVGLLGGLVANNPNHNPLNTHAPLTKQKMGMCHPDTKDKNKIGPTAMDISNENLVVNHLGGVVTMLQPRIGEIDSRFLLLSQNAPHLDGVGVAIGRLANPESLDSIQQWETSLVTSHGVPTSVVLKIVDCGLIEGNSETENDDESGDGTTNKVA